MSLMDKKLFQLSTQRGNIGSIQSRLDVAISTLHSSVENFRAAESRIKDADIAVDAAGNALTILQQATAAVLAQAINNPRSL
jgi:flagellin